ASGACVILSVLAASSGTSRRSSEPGTPQQVLVTVDYVCRWQAYELLSSELMQVWRGMPPPRVGLFCDPRYIRSSTADCAHAPSAHGIPTRRQPSAGNLAAGNLAASVFQCGI